MRAGADERGKVSINIPSSRSFANRVEIFVAECRRDRAASSHELQASLVFVGAFESRVDRRRSFAGAARRSLLNRCAAPTMVGIGRRNERDAL